MNCHDVEQVLLEEPLSSRWSPELQNHLTSCRACRELRGSLANSRPIEAPSPATLSRIQRHLNTDLRPVRPLASVITLFLTFTGVFLFVPAFGLYRLGSLGIGVMNPIQSATILSALSICAGLLIYSLILQMVPGSRHSITPGLLPLGVPVALLLIIGVLFQVTREEGFWSKSWFCINAGIQIGLLAAVPIWLILRRGALTSPRVAGAAAGLLSGLVAMSALELHCPNLDVRHIVVSHLGVAILSTILGFAIGCIPWRGEAIRPTLPI